MVILSNIDIAYRSTTHTYAIRNASETSIGGRAIKTTQQQNDIGAVRAPKGEQTGLLKKGDPLAQLLAESKI